MSCECKMLNTHNSLIIREQQNKIEAPADSPNFNEQQTFVCCFFVVCSCGQAPYATTKKKHLAYSKHCSFYPSVASHLITGCEDICFLIAPSRCAIRYPRFDFVGRAPADSRRKRRSQAFSFCVNSVLPIVSFSIFKHTPNKIITNFVC